MIRAGIAGSSAAILLITLVGFQPALAVPRPAATLDAGFAQLYELRFASARTSFTSYIQDHPQDPMGQAALAASYLFEEFNKQGILTSSFFLNDKKLLGGIPDPHHNAEGEKFLQADERAREMANALLKTSPRNANALFVLTLANGMQADYDALIAKEGLSSLSLLHRTQKSARLLLSINPEAGDAYLALGAANYIIGCLPGYKRFFLRFARIHGDRTLGMRQLKLAAEKGHYLKPFAKVLLALAALRERQPKLARSLLTELHQEFPLNSDFADELAKLNRSGEPDRISR